MARIPYGSSPAVILIITVLAFNLIGDAIRDAMDVRLQRP
jgi:peptide/nickel transport system permease protein